MQNGLIQSFNVEMEMLSTTKFENVALDLFIVIKKQTSDIIYLSHVLTWLMLQDSQEVGLITNLVNLGLI